MQLMKRYMPPIQYRLTTKFDAYLHLTVCDRYNNANLTLVLRLFLNKIDPPPHTGSFPYPDSDGVPRQIVPWGPQFEVWKKRFKRSCENFWHGKFWLKAPDSFEEWDFQDKHWLYRPNLWCCFRLQLVNSAARAHHIIDCVRLHKSELFHRSNAVQYDNRDLQPRPRPHGSPKKTQLHEVGHLLGLPHVGVGGPSSVGKSMCTILSNMPGKTQNIDECYGIMPENQRDVMGTGSELRRWHARPWQRAAQMLSGVKADSWEPAMQRHYPRGLQSIGLPGKGWQTARPNRS